MIRAAAALAAAAAVAAAAAPARPTAAASDWPLFGYTPSRENSGPAADGISAAAVKRLVRHPIDLDGTVDSSPIYLHGVSVRGRSRDVIFVTTTYGKTEAIDAAARRVLWRFVPATYASYAGTAQITNMSPAADPARTAIYVGAPDGRIRKLAVATGRELWSTSITRDPTHEKLTSSLNVAGGRVVATTGGYIGDAPPYQGHVVTLDAATGRVLHVWNSLCSDRHAIIEPSTCAASDSAIWARSGAVVAPGSGDLLVGTGNGPFDGRRNWGDSVLVLSPDAAKLLRHWTPADEAELDRSDLDLGSTAPALLAGGLAVQAGKDGKVRLLSLGRLAGADARLGGELQTVSTPGGADLFSAPAVWQGTWLFLATSAGTSAWVLRGGRLHAAWSNGSDGTSPIVAGGLLYVQGQGRIEVYEPASGRVVAELACGPVHWQSPIAIDGRVVTAEGNANDHRTTGVLDVYSAS